MAARPALLLAVTVLLSAAVEGLLPLTPTPTTPLPSTPSGNCPVDKLKLEVCANVMNQLRLDMGVPDDEQCCPLLQGLVDLDAAACLCLAMRANVLGVEFDVPVDLTLLLSYCNKDRVAGFTCPAN